MHQIRMNETIQDAIADDIKVLGGPKAAAAIFFVAKTPDRAADTLRAWCNPSRAEEPSADELFLRPLDKYLKLNALMQERAGGGLTHGHDCDECRKVKRDQRRAEKQGGAPEVEEVPNNNPKLAVPYCMPVDIEWNGDDFVLTQDNDGTTHTVFLAPHALRRLWEFGQGLAEKQAGAAA